MLSFKVSTQSHLDHRGLPSPLMVLGLLAYSTMCHKNWPWELTQMTQWMKALSATPDDGMKSPHGSHMVEQENQVMQVILENNNRMVYPKHMK